MVQGAVRLRQGQDRGGMGRSARRFLFGGREDNHPRNRLRQYPRGVPARQGQGHPGELPRPVRRDAPSVLRLLPLAQARVRSEGGHPRGHPRHTRMASGEVRRAVGGLLSRLRPGLDTGHLSVRHRQPGRRHPGEEARLRRHHRPHDPGDDPRGELRRDHGAGGRGPEVHGRRHSRAGGGQGDVPRRDQGYRREDGPVQRPEAGSGLLR